MFAQNLFYYSVSSAIIVVAIFICIILIACLVLLKKLSTVIGKIDQTMETIKEKIKISAFVGLASQGIKEIIDFIRERKGGNKNQ